MSSFQAARWECFASTKTRMGDKPEISVIICRPTNHPKESTPYITLFEDTIIVSKTDKLSSGQDIDNQMIFKIK